MPPATEPRKEPLVGMHFAGSLPLDAAATDADRLRWHLEHAVGRRLETVPADRDPDWLVRWLQQLRTVPSLAMLKRGDFTSRDQLGIYVKRPFHRLTPDQLGLAQAAQVRAMMPEFRRLRDEYDRPGSRLQIGLPSAVDLGFMAFQPGFLRHYKVIAAALRQQVAEVMDEFGDEVVFQLETPCVLIFLTLAPPALRPLLARRLAAAHANFLASLPAGTRVIVHLCYADMEHTSVVTPKSLRPAVQFANEFAARLRRHQLPLPPLFVPAAYGDQPPPPDDAFYAPLRQLDPEFAVIAGLVHEHQPARSQAALDLFTTHLGRAPYAVCTACGLGRRTAADAEAAARLQHTLAGKMTNGAAS